jgi:hypothetical protein
MNRGISTSRLAFFVLCACLWVACFVFVLLGIAGPAQNAGNTQVAPLVKVPRALLNAMETQHNLAARADAMVAGFEEKRTRVCIVTMEIGFSSPGGIGTAYTGLALALVERGHDVTVLFVDDNRHTREEWMVILAPLERILNFIASQSQNVRSKKKKKPK